MIHIIPKPTDTPDDNSTGMVMDALRKMGVPFEVLDLASVDPFNLPVSGETIWACGIKQDGVQFELLKALEMENRVINSTEAIATCASKVTTTAKMFHIGAPSPATCFTNDKAVVQRFVDEHGRSGRFFLAVFVLFRAQHNCQVGKATLLILGNEETGISPDLLKLSDVRAKLPIVGEVASLNVSVAAGVFMYEALEQRGE